MSNWDLNCHSCDRTLKAVPFATEGECVDCFSRRCEIKRAAELELAMQFYERIGLIKGS